MVYGQATIDPKVQQLKDAWYQKAQELSELGTKLIEKNKLLENLQNDMIEVARNNIAIDGTGQVYPILIEKFNNKLFHAVRDNINVKGFLIQELINNRGEFFKDKRCLGLLDKVKLICLQIIIEADLTKKILEDYEECLQKMAEIENELVLLGQPRLYE